MRIQLYITAAFLLIFAASCTKVIDVKTGNNTGDLVIEGNVTNISGPQIINLSTNVPLTNTNTYPPVTGATVIVQDQAGNSYPFTESPAGKYTSGTFAGIAGNVYTMTVTNGAKSYTAKSTMPTLVALDSVTSKNSIISSSSNKKQITVHYKDPGGIANQYRFVMYVNGVQVKAVFAQDDEFNDGKYVDLDLFEDDIDVYSGNTVRVEMQSVDKSIYTYWFTLMQQGGQGPGGSVTPSNPPNNISPTTLGYFSAHTTQTITIKVK